MKTAGGIIAIVGGVFGVGAAIATLFAGGVGAALDAEGANTVIGLGWLGLLFSFLTIIFGAVAIGVKRRLPGILLVISAIIGAIAGGTFVAICMALVIVGGILAIAGGGQKAAPESA